jgi:DNA mismatch repair ATPase MutS
MIRESGAGCRSLFLLDEIFKGTNTVERIAAGKAVLSHIAKNGKVHFDYLLKHGKMTTRNAIRILEINGYPKEIIEEARRTSQRIQNGGVV